MTGYPTASDRTPDVTRPAAGSSPIRAGGRSIAWFHCFAGIAGDMALGSLLDAGADLGEVLALLDRLPLGGWALEVEPVLRGGVAASHAVVTVQDNVVVRTHAHIVGLVEEARLARPGGGSGPGHLRRAGRRGGQTPPSTGGPGPFPRGGGTRHHRGRGGNGRGARRSSASTRSGPARWPPGSA